MVPYECANVTYLFAIVSPYRSQNVPSNLVTPSGFPVIPRCGAVACLWAPELPNADIGRKSETLTNYWWLSTFKGGPKTNRGPQALDGISSKPSLPPSSWILKSTPVEPSRSVTSRMSHKRILVGGFNPLKNMKVSWDDEIPNIWRNKHVLNHQPVPVYILPLSPWYPRFWL